MPDQPLRAFAPPSGPFFDQLQFSGSLAPSFVIQWVLFGVFICWMIYTVVAIYHWLRYSHASLVAVPAIATHLFISFVLFGYAVSGALPV
jgi:hypothetical protein